MRIAHFALAGLGLLAGAGPALAGPIWFTYRVDGYTTRNEAGDVSIQTLFTGPVSLDPPSNPSVVLATVRLGGKPHLVLGPTGGLSNVSAALSRFALEVQISDTTSDQIGVVRFTGWAERYWTRDDGGRVLTNGIGIGFDHGVEVVTVGGRKYEIVGAGANGYPTDDVFGTLSVRPSAAIQTPEPGTLALAGVGLAAAGGFYARRRRTALTPSS